MTDIVNELAAINAERNSIRIVVSGNIDLDGKSIGDVIKSLVNIQQRLLTDGVNHARRRP